MPTTPPRRFTIICALIVAGGCQSTICTVYYQRHRCAWDQPDGGAAVAPNASSATVVQPDEFFEQPLDHFTPADRRTWRQRFLTNAEFYAPGAPVFLMIGGEAAVSPRWMSQGAWVHYAREHSAMLVLLEHRYYGKSQPTDDLSTENLRYLSSQQALADLATFIADQQRSKFPPNTRWLAFGCSYSGALAAWLRLKHPRLLHAAISASGPLLAKADFHEYFAGVVQALADFNPLCVRAIGRSTEQLELMLRHQNHLSDLTRSLRLCDELTTALSANDLAILFQSLASRFGDQVQYNRDNSPNALLPIDAVCGHMLNSSIGAEWQRFAHLNDRLLQLAGQTCLDYRYDKFIAFLRDPRWPGDAAASGQRQWTYQTCSEFGWFHSSGDVSLSASAAAVFGRRFPIELFYAQCADTFGAKRFDRRRLRANVAQTNARYGALRLRTTNVLFVHGSVDPWHVLGRWRRDDDRPEMPVLFVRGAAHCAPLYEPLAGDAEPVRRARAQIGRFIRQVLI